MSCGACDGGSGWVFGPEGKIACKTCNAIPACRCGEPAVQVIFSHGPHCEGCVDLFDQAFAERRYATKARRAAAEIAKKDDERQLQIQLDRLRPSSIRCHLRCLTRSEPAACGVYGDSYTDDPAQVTCLKCGPAAKLRPGPLPEIGTPARTQAIQALVAKGIK